MPDGSFSIIDEKTFSNLNFQIRVHSIIVSGGDSPSVLYPMPIGLNKPPISPLLGGLFEPIGMGSSAEGSSPPEMMNWMHADLQIEVEKWPLIDD